MHIIYTYIIINFVAEIKDIVSQYKVKHIRAKPSALSQNPSQ